MSAHLRGLQEEFHESTNGIRIELNRLEEAGMLLSEMDGQKKVFRVALDHPLFTELNSIVRKYVGLDKLVEKVVADLGGLNVVYLVGDLAEGKFSNEIKLLFLGDMNSEYLEKLMTKVEILISKKICYQVFTDLGVLESALQTQKNVLLWRQ